MTNHDFGKYNAEQVLRNVDRLIAEYPENASRYWTGTVRGYRIADVSEDLSIFDWWPDYLSSAKLAQMREFLEVAIENGYTGYVCFKVGAKGCANGMWAHKKKSTTGYSPDGEYLYRSFTPEYTYWSVKAADGKDYPADGDGYDSCKTARQVRKLIASANGLAEADGTERDS